MLKKQKDSPKESQSVYKSSKRTLLQLQKNIAEGGTRTRTEVYLQRILSPSCIPVSPPRPVRSLSEIYIKLLNTIIY